MFILKKGHQPGVYVPFRALFLVELKRVLVCLLWNFVCLRLYVLVHNFSVTLGQLSGFNQY